MATIKTKNAQGGWDTYCPHGVGDILETENPTSPAERWPGTVWAAMGAGRVLVGVDPSDTDFDVIGATGGNKTAALTADNNGPHSHDVYNSGGLKVYQTSGTEGYGLIVGYDGSKGNSPVKAVTSGKGSPFRIMQPYEVVYRWLRTA